MKDIETELNKLHMSPKCELSFSNNFELLIAVILSAQCTDKRVNQIVKPLFEKYKTPQDFAKLSPKDLEKEIYSLGFYHNKAKNIIEMSKELVKNYNGEVPNNFEDLVKLAGVGRKTASVVLSVGYNKPAFAVDTHVFRVANRLGVGNEKSVEKCEESLKKHFDKAHWSKIHLQMVLFGRNICKARNPNCKECTLKEICKKYSKEVK